jgi:hypothetical protein
MMLIKWDTVKIRSNGVMKMKAICGAILLKEMLYSDDQKLTSRFINPAPFSKFYLEIDNESQAKWALG